MAQPKPLCTECCQKATQSYLTGDCCAYGSVAKLVEALSLKARDSELDLTRFRLEATKVEEAKTSALKQLDDFE